MRARGWVPLAVLTAAALAGGGLLARSPAADAQEQPAAPPIGTAAVRRQDIVVTETVTGRLGYGDSRTVSTFTAGVVTAAASRDATIQPGERLFAVDRRPVVLLRGSLPAYRALSTAASDGRDVEQLERELQRLGHGDDLRVDRHFDRETAAAVRRWERSIGRPAPDGTVELGDIVFADEPVRVLRRTAPPGTQLQSGAAVLQVSSATKLVELDLDADRAQSVDVGDVVRLELPDGTRATGAITSFGTQAESDEAPIGADARPSVPVVVEPQDPRAVEALDGGSVEVEVESDRVDDALTVPVEALLALAEGGYALQVAGSGALVPVTVGLISDDLAEVRGEQVRDGLRVAVPL